MKKIAILLMFIPFSLSAVNWVVVKDDQHCENTRISIDSESIRKSKGKICCWFRYDYCGEALQAKIVELDKLKRESNTHKDDDSYNPSKLSHVLEYYSFNIKLSQSTVLSRIEYSTGGSVMSSFQGKEEDFSYIIPGSVGESLIKYAKEAYSKYEVQK